MNIHARNKVVRYNVFPNMDSRHYTNLIRHLSLQGFIYFYTSGLIYGEMKEERIHGILS